MSEPFSELRHFKVAKFRALYKVGDEGLNLPRFKGGTFRGTFGSVLKEVACTCSKNAKGHIEHHSEDCVYAYLFETKNFDQVGPATADSVPRPFLFDPPDQEKTFYQPGEDIWLGFSLFGAGIEYLPYFIYTLQAMGQRGFGRENHTATLLQVFSVDLDGRLVAIYQNSDQIIKNKYYIFTGRDIIKHRLPSNEASSEKKRLSVIFSSPTRLKYSGKYIDNPVFHIILRSMVRRITSLLYAHHDQQRIDIDFADFFKRAEDVQAIRSDASWREWQRYSNKQKQRLKMGGIEGSAIFYGDMHEYLPWLALAEWTNIGKNATFGLGRIHVLSE